MIDGGDFHRGQLSPDDPCRRSIAPGDAARRRIPARFVRRAVASLPRRARENVPPDGSRLDRVILSPSALGIVPRPLAFQRPLSFKQPGFCLDLPQGGDRQSDLIRGQSVQDHSLNFRVEQESPHFLALRPSLGVMIGGTNRDRIIALRPGYRRHMRREQRPQLTMPCSKALPVRGAPGRPV